MDLEKKYLKIKQNGQALVETLVVLLLLTSLVSGFFIYIYRSTLTMWIEYNLNQAINCENSMILQTKKYLTKQKTPNIFAKGNTKKSDVIEKILTATPHRKNRNCLAKAKADIQKITPWEKIEVKRIKSNDNYEASTKWDGTKIMRIKANSLNIITKAKKSQIKVLL